jgi:hypothetical protein
MHAAYGVDDINKQGPSGPRSRQETPLMSVKTRKLAIAGVAAAMSTGAALAIATPAHAAAPDTANSTTVTIHANHHSAKRWHTVQLTGTTKPNRHGDQVSVQQKVGSGHWNAFNAHSVVRNDGGYEVKVASGRTGLNRFRVVVDGQHSHAVKVKVS